MGDDNILVLLYVVVLPRSGSSAIQPGNQPGNRGVFTALTPEESTIKWIKTFYVNIPIGVALIIGGRFVLKRTGTQTKGDQCKDQI